MSQDDLVDEIAGDDHEDETNAEHQSPHKPGETHTHSRVVDDKRVQQGSKGDEDTGKESQPRPQKATPKNRSRKKRKQRNLKAYLLELWRNNAERTGSCKNKTSA